MKICGLLFALLGVASSAVAQMYSVGAEVYFENFEKTIVSEIANAKESVHVQIYKFNSQAIAQSLIEAKNRGLSVVVMTDAKAARSARNRAGVLHKAGIVTYVDDKHATMHNKVMLVDRDRVITGSYNYTKKADRKNAENILILVDKELRDRYFENWQQHLEHSLLYSEFVKDTVAR